jgi:hypothetical protein
MSTKILKLDKFLIVYILLVFVFGYYWRIWQIELNDLKVVNPKYRFLIRFVFGFGFYVLAFAYLKLKKLNLAIKYLSYIYIIVEAVLLFIGVIRFYIYDHPQIISLYGSLLGLTVSPLGMLFALIFYSLDIRNKKEFNSTSS